MFLFHLIEFIYIKMHMNFQVDVNFSEQGKCTSIFIQLNWKIVQLYVPLASDKKTTN